MLTVKQVADLTGITVRTLHHYDQIGLLKPGVITQSGYRKYGDSELQILEQILFFRELDFSLDDIKRILSDPSYSPNETLLKHRKMLELKRNRLDGLIKLVDDTLRGEKDMSFKAFDMSKINEMKEKYSKEAEEKYGTSDAYKESKEKTDKYKESDWERISGEQVKLYTKLAKYIGTDPAGVEVQELVHQCREHITNNYYNCTLEMFEGLGQMYVGDERFTQNIDQYGEGLAQLLSDAIVIYVVNRA